MGSTRLPGKVLKEVLGKSILEHIVFRLKRCPKIDGIIIATTSSPLDDLIEREAERLTIPYFRGSEENVLERYYQAALHYHLHTIVRVTADCPLVDPELLTKMLEVFFQQSQAGERI